MENKPCFTCEIVSEYVGLANQFTQDLSEALLGPMWVLYLSLAALWVVIQGLRLALLQTTLAELAKEFMFVMIAGFLLSGQGPELVNNIYKASLAMMGSAASVALQVGNQGDAVVAAAPGAIPLEQGMVSLVRFAEEGIRMVFRLAGEIAGSASMVDPLPILYALVLVVPYFLLLIVYFSQVVVSIFRIQMLATLSPYLMLGFGFGWGRDMMKAGIRTLLAAFMVLFGATAALAVTLYGVTNLGIEGMASEDVAELASINNTKFLLAVALGWLGTAFMTEATGIANSIANSSLTNTAAGVITAGAMATGAALLSNPAARAAMGAASGVAGSAGWGAAGAAFNPKGIGAAAANAYGSRAQAVKDLVDKAKQYGQAKE